MVANSFRIFLSLATVVAASQILAESESATHAAEAAEVQSESRAVRAQAAISNSSDALARWIDGFFDSPNIEAEDANSRLELRQTATFIERDDNEQRVRLSAKLKLPNLSRRLSLTFRGNADQAELEEDGVVQTFDDTDTDTDALDNPEVGLQYIFKEKGGYHGSASVGTRLDNPSINFGPRFRYQHQLSESWRGRYTERFLWDTDEGWESRTKFEFDRLLEGGGLFRQSLRADWRQSRKDENGMRYTLKSAYVQRLENNAALRYEVASRYTTKPRMSWIGHRVSLNYRRKIWQDWMFFEAGPFLAFEKKHDWHANPGFRLALDIVFSNETAFTDNDED